MFDLLKVRNTHKSSILIGKEERELDRDKNEIILSPLTILQIEIQNIQKKNSVGSNKDEFEYKKCESENNKIFQLKNNITKVSFFPGSGKASNGVHNEEEKEGICLTHINLNDKKIDLSKLNSEKKEIKVKSPENKYSSIMKSHQKVTSALKINIDSKIVSIYNSASKKSESLKNTPVVINQTSKNAKSKNFNLKFGSRGETPKNNSKENIGSQIKFKTSINVPKVSSSNSFADLIKLEKQNFIVNPF